MKVTFTVDIEFDPFFIDEDEPRDWQLFFKKYCFPYREIGNESTNELIILEECIINNFKIS